MNNALIASISFSLNGAFRVALALIGVSFVFYFFKSIIRLGILNQRYQDPLAFWVGRIVLYLFRFRVFISPKGSARRNEIMVWYWPCALIGVISVWFLLVTFGFAFLNIAFRTNASFAAALISSGSALSTLGFSTPGGYPGQFLAIVEGAIGLFLVVYLFTFLPGFLDLIHERSNRVAWIYARTGPKPSGAALLHWYCRNGRTNDLEALWEDWEIFFRTLAQARSFLPILCVVRPIDMEQSWICAFGAFIDAIALRATTLEQPSESSRLCLTCGIDAIRNMHSAMRGTPINPARSPEQMHVKRQEYDAACHLLASAGIPLAPDRETAWKRFIEAHMLYEEEIAWLAAAISDPRPFWPAYPEDGPKIYESVKVS